MMIEVVICYLRENDMQKKGEEGRISAATG
jgi:hypothetical protein